MTIEYVLTKSVCTQSTLPTPPIPDARYIRLAILYNRHSTIHSGRPRKAYELPGFHPLAVPLSFYIFIPSTVILPCVYPSIYWATPLLPRTQHIRSNLLIDFT